MFKEKILPKLVLLNTRLVVGTYTALTLPFYTVTQRPWQKLRLARARRTVAERSPDGSFQYWKRHGAPITLPNDYHLYRSFNEIFDFMKRNEDRNQPRLSYREVYSEKIKFDHNGW